MNIKKSIIAITLLGLIACNTDTQDDEPWWTDDQYNEDDTDADDTDMTDDGKDDDGKDDDGGKNAPDCDKDFDPSEPCEGDPKSTACMFGDDLYYCDAGKWVIYTEEK